MKLCLLPGTMCTEKLWSEIRPRLNPAIKLVSLTIPQNMNIEAVAEHLQQQLPDEPINLIGFSLGGYLASYIATQIPQRMQRLLVIANNPSQFSAQTLKHRAALLEFAQTYGYKGISRVRAAELIDSGDRNSPIVDNILDMDRELGAAEFISQYQHTSARVDLSASINRLTFPTWFYFSEQDPLIDSTWFETLSPNNTNIRIRPTSGRGHMLPLEKPEELVQLIEDWLKTAA